MSGTVHTQTIAGFFSNLKRGIAGTYRSLSRKWRQSYLNDSRSATTVAVTRARCSSSYFSAR